ncbi:MAG: TonB-dependent receptor [Bryobacteraceae bacterium]|nr:TonB-dependent receptor [Bryobacteraceae bacterium]
MIRLAWRLLCVSIVCLGAAGADIRISGRVTNETSAPVRGARISFRSGDVTLHAISDVTGAFSLDLPQPGDYLVTVEREGHFTLLDTPIHIDESSRDLSLVLNRLREVVESVDVTAATTSVAMDTTTKQETLTGNEILNVPYPSTNNLKNAMAVMPGIVQDSRGEIHVNGAAADQVQYTLDGFNLTDPLTGRFESRISVEGVQSVEVVSGRVPAEFGKGSAGAIAFHSKPGDDRFRTSATNFFPGIENQKGIYIGNWTPRFNVSGPWRRSRAWFSNSLDIHYDRRVVPELPRGQDSTSSWQFSNLLHNQFNLSPSHILYSSFLINNVYAPRAGLTNLDPLETTVDHRARQYFFNVRSQKYFAKGAVFETGFAINRTFGREIPQGRSIYILTPVGNRGNFFTDAVRKASRDQWISNLILPSFEFKGTHQLKTGVDFNRLSYWQHVDRTGFEFLRMDGTPLRRTEFRGDGLLSRSNTEAALYLQDSWRVRPGLLLELGIRSDWDQIIRDWNLSPRVGFAWAPFGLENTKIAGGYAISYDSTNLRIITRPDDQYSVTTYYGPDGSIDRGPAVSVFRVIDDQLRSPRYRNLSLSLEQRLPHALSMRINLLRRRGARGFTFYNALGPSSPPEQELVRFQVRYFDGIYYLGNQRHDQYDSAEIIVHQTLRGQYEWMASYTRSRARSNAVIDISAEQPTLVSDNAGPMPWDAPNRFLSWGYLPTFWKDWAVAYLFEYRTGFPFSVVNEQGAVVGPVNSHRFPSYVNLNLHIERRFSFGGHRWALRAGANNIMNRNNPNVVVNNIDAPNYLTFFGGSRRSFNFRIRWLGRT